MQLPAVQKGDELLPVFAAGGYLGYPVVVFFTVGIIAAAFSSADSALAALTTSCCIDLLEVGKMNPDKAVKVRKWVHLLISVLFIGCIVLLEELNSPSIIDTLYVLTSYTYGPLLGLFSFSLLTRYRVRDGWVPWIAVASPWGAGPSSSGEGDVFPLHGVLLQQEAGHSGGGGELGHGALEIGEELIV